MSMSMSADFPFFFALCSLFRRTLPGGTPGSGPSVHGGEMVPYELQILDRHRSSFASRVARTICDGSSAPAVCNRDTNGKVKQTIRESAPRSELWTAHSTTASPNTFCIGRFRSGLAAKPQKVRTKLQHCRELSSGERVHPFVKMWQLSMNAPCLNGRAGAIEGCRWCG